MPMNPLPPTGGPGAAAAAAPAGPGRKEEPGSPDSAFTALLLAMLGAQQVITPAAPAPDGENAPAAQDAPQAPAVTAPTLPAEIETLLQAQRVAVPAAAAAAAAAAAPAPFAVAVGPKAPADPEAPEGTWVVEPPAATAVQAPIEQTATLPEKDAAKDERKGTPLPAQAPAPEASAFPLQAAGAHQPAGVAPAATAHKAPAPIPTPIEPDRLMDAIARSAVSSGDGRYTVTLRLHPEQLGEIRLQLHVSGRDVATTLQVSNPAAQQLLEQKSDQLREGLTQSGLTLSGFHVATGQEQRQRETQQQFDQLAPRKRNRQSASKPDIAGTITRPVRLPGVRRPNGLDTLA